jgi:hypothetical protein
LNAKWPPKHLKTGLKKRPENDHSKTGRSGFWIFTVLSWQEIEQKREYVLPLFFN